MIQKILSAYKFDKTNFLTEETKTTVNAWSVRWCIKGEISVFIDDKGFILKQGQVLILPPNKSADFKINDNSLQFAITVFKGDLSISDNLLLKPISLLGREQELILDYFYTATQIFGDKIVKNAVAESYCYLALQTFLLRLVLSNGENQNFVLNERKKTSTHVSDQKITVDIKNYLENRVCETVTIEGLSQNLGVSKNALMKVFKADTGKSIMEYFTLQKVQFAQKLIVEGNLSFRTISEKLGFASPEYFSRTFKKHTGFTPTEFSINSTKWHGCLADFC